MRHQDSVLNQLLKHIPRYRFERIVTGHSGDRRVRSLRCWDQFVSLLYSQYSGIESLRDLVNSFNSHESMLYHLGCKPIKRSTLSDANRTRPVAIYEAVFGFLLGQLHKDQKQTKEALLLLDSTTMSLNQTLFGWASFRSKKNGVKLHLVYDPKVDTPTYFSISTAKTHDMKAARRFAITPHAHYVFDRAYNDYSWWQKLHEQGCTFVTRCKQNIRFVTESWKVPEGSGVLADDIGKLEHKGCDTTLRKIIYHCPTKDKTLTFITNDLKANALEIALRYKQRWQIELFFKWVKQNLKIKKFLGTSENAVNIQIIIALIAYLILRILQQQLPTKLTLKQIANLTKANILHRKPWLSIIKPPDKKTKINMLQQSELNLGLTGH